jgi:hypothetical protein
MRNLLSNVMGWPFELENHASPEFEMLAAKMALVKCRKQALPRTKP